MLDLQIPASNNFSWMAQTPHSYEPSNGFATFGRYLQPVHQGNHQQNRLMDPLKCFGSLPQYPKRRNKISTTSKTNLYISGLSEKDNDDTVRALVEGVVEPKSSKAMMANGKCKGSGFIDCVSEEDAEKAKKYIETSKANGRKLSVKYAFENEKDVLNVYVRNLPRDHFNKDRLQSLFTEFGNVTSVKLLESNKGYTGTGFVRFATAEEARDAVEQMNDRNHMEPGSDKPIVCKLADKTDPRRGGGGTMTSPTGMMAGKGGHSPDDTNMTSSIMHHAPSAGNQQGPFQGHPTNMHQLQGMLNNLSLSGATPSQPGHHTQMMFGPPGVSPHPLAALQSPHANPAFFQQQAAYVTAPQPGMTPAYHQPGGFLYSYPGYPGAQQTPDPSMHFMNQGQPAYHQGGQH